MCFQAVLSPGGVEELRPTRDLEGTLLRGYSRGSWRSGSRACCWSSASGVRRRPSGWSGRGDGTGREGPESCVRKGNARGVPSKASTGLSVLPFPRLPRGRGQASLGRQLPAARPLSARCCRWPAVLGCGRCKPSAMQGQGFLSAGTRAGRGAPAEPRACTCCPIGLYTLAHTTLLVARTTPALGTSFVGAPKMSTPVPQVWVVAPLRLL